MPAARPRARAWCTATARPATTWWRACCCGRWAAPSRARCGSPATTRSTSAAVWPASPRWHRPGCSPSSARAGSPALLDDLVDHIRRINETVLAGEHPSLRELAAATGRRPEPWRVAVLLGGGRADELSRHERSQLDRVLRTGAACGVHLIVRGLDRSPPGPRIEVIARGARRRRPARVAAVPCRYAWTRRRRPALVTATCRQIAEQVAAGPAPAALASLLPEQDVAGELGDGADRPARRQPAGRPVRGDPERLPAARPDRRTVRHRQDQPDLRLDRRAGRPLLPRRAGVLPARLQGGRVVRPVRAGPAGPELAAARPAGRGQRQHRPGVRAGPAALPRRRAAAARRRRQTARGDQPGRAAGRGPDRQLAADRGRGRRVPGAALRPGRRGHRGRRPAGGPGPTGSLAGHPPGAGQPGRVRHRGAVGASRAGRTVLPADRAAAAPAASSPRRTPPPRRCPGYHAVVNADSGASEANRVVRVPSAGDRDAWNELQHRLWRQRPAGPRRAPAVRRRRRPPARRLPGARAGSRPRAPWRRRWRCSGESHRRGVPVGPHGAAPRPRTQPRRPRHPGPTRRARCSTRRPDRSPPSSPPRGRPSRWPAWTRTPPPPAGRCRRRCPDTAGSTPATSTCSWRTSPPRPVRASRRGRTSCSCTRPTRSAPTAARPATCARSCTTVRNGGSTCWGGGGAPPGCGTPSAGRPPVPTPSARGWPWTCTAANWPPYYPGHGAPSWYPRPWRALHFDRAVHRGPEVIIPYGAP